MRERAVAEISRHTTLCISVAERPGNLGTAMHNAAYEALGLDFVYKAFRVTDIAGAIAGVRALGIRGCSVSMPFKESVIAHLDDLDDTARAIGAVNTVVNESGRLTGYNTDVAGARAALAVLQVRPGERVLLLGAGGVARAILRALSGVGVGTVRVAARDRARVGALPKGPACLFVPWEARALETVDILINATPIGMTPAPDAVPVEGRALEGCRAVMDAVVSPLETALIRKARALGKTVSPGYVMNLEQTAAQFRIYTGVVPPMDVLERALRSSLGS
jgi:shikimate dehydrogenase